MLSVVVPALNEERTIGAVVERIRKNTPGGTEIIVVDNGSADATSFVAQAQGARVLLEPARGKGNALRRGASSARGSLLMFMDADGSHFPEDIPELVRTLKEYDCDMVYASRLLKDDYSASSSKHRMFGSRLFAWLASRMYMPISDILTGMYIIRRDAFETLDLSASGFDIEADIFIQAYRNNLSIAEIGASYKRSPTSHLSPVRDGVKILKTLLVGKLNI